MLLSCLPDKSVAASREDKIILIRQPEDKMIIDTSPENRLCSITIMHKLKNNNNGQSKHWSTSHTERKKWMKALESSTVYDEERDIHVSLGDYIAQEELPFSQRVGVEVHRVLGPRERHWDPDSVLRGSCKQLVDSLVQLKVLTDDNSKCIVWCVGTQSEQRASEPATVVRFYGAK